MCTRGILLFCFSVFRKSEPEAACGALTREHKLECLEDAFTSLQGMYHNRHEAQHESGDFLQRPGYWSDPRTENCLCFSRRIFGQRIQLSKRSFCFCCKESSIQQVYGPWELSSTGCSAGIEMLRESLCFQITDLSLHPHLCCVSVVYLTGMP
ncbi:uncharacterized protein LOC129737458 isoform X6 [Falco cherrug]|uniref:uncharacterized protein LOC129737458 isoform X6 n=1 Tax=Falco cherrug TaxID=345164 RepID=UPI002479DB5E|nr:uncharacterized protein LOC129737458 isoform X6 [Falco cherrug]